MTASLTRAHAAGVAYLVASQRADGAWHDYHAMPIGAATEWVTGFVTAALTETARELARDAIDRGVAALLAARRRGSSWGFNASVAADADSTAWAIHALRGAGALVPREALAFVLGLQRRDGGFATYARDDAWGESHPDVTPVVALALVAEAPELAYRALAFAFAHADPDGTWPAYWWRGRHYSSYWNRRLLAAYGHDCATRQKVPLERSRWIVSAFDLAWVLALAVLDADPACVLEALAEQLVAQQQSDGRWPGSDDLRITAPICSHSWVEPLGAYATDDCGLVTTASAVRALGLSIAAITATSRPQPS